MEKVRIITQAGEDYVNVNDLESVMYILFRRARFTTLPVLSFIKTIIHNLQGGDHVS